MTRPLIELTDVSRAFGGLRPLRIEHLSLLAGHAVAVVGFDGPAAETFVNLVMGAALPEAGEVRLFGRPTSSISDSAEWLALADRFGVVSRRAVLLDAFTVLQNLAVPFSLEVDPLGDDLRQRALALAREVELPETSWDAAVGSLGGLARARVHLGRALALDPAILLLEHAAAIVGPDERRKLGSCIRSVASRRGTAILALTADEVFAEAVAARVLHLEAASGKLTGPRRRDPWWKRRSR